MTQAYTHNFTEVHEAIAFVAPVSKGVGTHTTDWFDMQAHQRVIFLVAVGAIAASGEMVFTVQQARDAAGTGAKGMGADGFGHTIETLTQLGGDGDDLIAVEVRTEQMDVDARFRYLRGVTTISTAAAVMCVIPLTGASSYPPVGTDEWTEIVLS